jgi:hypothetical protein
VRRAGNQPFVGGRAERYDEVVVSQVSRHAFAWKGRAHDLPLDIYIFNGAFNEARSAAGRHGLAARSASVPTFRSRPRTGAA